MWNCQKCLYIGASRHPYTYFTCYTKNIGTLNSCSGHCPPFVPNTISYILYISWLWATEAKKNAAHYTICCKKVEVTGFEPATFWSRILISHGVWILVCPFESFFDRICLDGKVLSIGAICVADNWLLTGVDWSESWLNGSIYLPRCFCDPLAGSKTLSTLIQKCPGKPLKIRGFRGCLWP